MTGNVLGTLGPLSVTRFGAILAEGALAWLLTALWIRSARYRRRVRAGEICCTAAWMVLLGVVCSRTLYCLTNYDRYLLSDGGWAAALRLWQGGGSLVGGLAGATAGICIGSVLSGSRSGSVANCFAPGWGLFAACAALALRQTGEGWGKLIEAERLAGTFLTVQDRYGEWRFAVYRLDAAAGAAVFLLALTRMGSRKRPPAWEAYGIAVALWAAARVVTASMREGALLRVEYFRVEQIGAMAALIGIAIRGMRADGRAGRTGRRLLRILLLAAGAALATAMEFAVDREGYIEAKYAAMLAGSMLCCAAAILPRAGKKEGRRAGNV